MLHVWKWARVHVGEQLVCDHSHPPLIRLGVVKEDVRTRFGQYHLWGQSNRSSATADTVVGHRHAAIVDAVLDQVKTHAEICEHSCFTGSARVGNQDVVQPATNA